MRLDRVSLRTSAILIVLGGTSLVLYRAGLGADGVADISWFIKLALVQSAIYLVAVWLVLHARPSRSTFLLVVIFAAVFRLGIVFAPPYLSDDIYRYVWDGRVQAAGINPYRHVPSTPELAHLRDAQIYPKINRREYAHTIYPPLAESIFLVTTRISESVVWMKLTMLGFELLGLWAMVQLLTSYGLAQQRLLIYAWHPLVVWELAGSGHVDAIAIAFIALALLACVRQMPDFQIKSWLRLRGRSWCIPGEPPEPGVFRDAHAMRSGCTHWARRRPPCRSSASRNPWHPPFELCSGPTPSRPGRCGSAPRKEIRQPY